MKRHEDEWATFDEGGRVTPLSSATSWTLYRVAAIAGVVGCTFIAGGLLMHLRRDDEATGEELFFAGIGVVLVAIQWVLKRRIEKRSSALELLLDPGGRDFHDPK